MFRAKMMGMLATVLAVSLGCFAQAPRVVAEKLCAQWDQAWANHDLDQVIDFIDSSFVNIDERGKHADFVEFRRQVARNLSLSRNLNQSTTVEHVRFEAGRMVVNWKFESHYEYYDQRNGWLPTIYKSTGESTWEKKGGQWKLVEGTTFRRDAQVDPAWLEHVRRKAQDRIDAAHAAGKVDEMLACGNNPSCRH
jgi:hypothetical protein